MWCLPKSDVMIRGSHEPLDEDGNSERPTPQIYPIKHAKSPHKATVARTSCVPPGTSSNTETFTKGQVLLPSTSSPAHVRRRIQDLKVGISCTAAVACHAMQDKVQGPSTYTYSTSNCNELYPHVSLVVVIYTPEVYSKHLPDSPYARILRFVESNILVRPMVHSFASALCVRALRGGPHHGRADYHWPRSLTRDNFAVRDVAETINNTLAYLSNEISKLIGQNMSLK